MNDNPIVREFSRLVDEIRAEAMVWAELAEGGREDGNEEAEDA